LGLGAGLGLGIGCGLGLGFGFGVGLGSGLVVDELTYGLIELGVAAREGAILLRDRGSGKGYG